MKTSKNTQEDKPGPKPKEELKPHTIKWTVEFANNLYENFLKEYLEVEITGFLLYNFMTGRKESIKLYFKPKLSKMELVRLGFMMGMTYDMMNIAFLEYRIGNNLKGRLNSTSCPKTKESFMNGGKIVKDLLHFLKENDCPFVYSLQSKQEKVNYFKNLISDRDANIEIIEDKIRNLTEQLEYENARKKCLESKVEELERE